jgi:esterase/lipase
LKLLKQRDSQTNRAYLKKKKDVHEKDVDFLLNSRKSALKLVKEIKNFIKIDCAEADEILSREEIHEKIYEQVKKVLK